MKIIDGKKLATQILGKVKKEIKKLPTTPGLAVILVGDDPSSKIYIRKKEEACAEARINFKKFLYDKNASNKELFARIRELNERKNIHAILVQLPLPKHLDVQKIISTISPKKDVDGFLKKSNVIPPTVAGILELIKSTRKGLSAQGEPTSVWKNKKAVILANSKTFADPLKKLLKKKGCGVKILIRPKRSAFAKATADKQKLDADIIVSALGRPKFIAADMVRNNTIIIDVGITRVDKKIVGDADVESLKNKPCWLTPVPGGVGPMTVAMLIKNVLTLSK